MTGEQLRAWRKSRDLSQEQLAELLGWTRDQVANVELERTTMKENIEHKLSQADESMRRQPPPNSSKPAPPKYDYSNHKCWTLSGQPIAFETAQAKPAGFQFYRQDNSTDVYPDTGHQKANLYETTRKRRRGQCTDFSLDLVEWQVKCTVLAFDPARIEICRKLNALLQPQIITTPTKGMFL